jgi:hypothetical protein
MGLLEGFAEGEPDGAADGVEVAWGEGERRHARRVLNGLAAVKEIQELEGDAHAPTVDRWTRTAMLTAQAP